MDFALNEEQKAFKERCRTFAREVIRPAARQHDEDESTPLGGHQGGPATGPAGS